MKPREMTDQQKIAALLEQCKAYHRALDLAYAMLISRDKTFFPSKSPMWPITLAGHRLIRRLTAASTPEN
jgi:hypothetical protein